MRSLHVIAALVAWSALAAFATAGKDGLVTIFDFSSDSQAWPSIDDTVMGGVSASDMSVRQGVASFRGTVSFDNNGGFASVRSRPERHDLGAFDGLVLEVRGDGKRYGFRLRTTDAFDGVSYQAELAPPPGEWVEVELPFSAFEPVYRGRRVPDHPPLDPSRVTTFGLIIARQEGPFRLDLAGIHGYRRDDSGDSKS